MAAQPKEYFDIKTAAKKDTYLIDARSIDPDVIASRFKKVNGVEKIFYATMVISALIIAIGLLYIKTKTTEIESNTININTSIYQKQEKLSEYKQQIQDLAGNDSLYKISDKAGLKMNYSNVLKATK